MEGSFISTKTEAKKEIDLATASHHVKELFFHTMRERRKAGRIPQIAAAGLASFPAAAAPSPEERRRRRRGVA